MTNQRIEDYIRLLMETGEFTDERILLFELADYLERNDAEYLMGEDERDALALIQAFYMSPLTWSGEGWE